MFKKKSDLFADKTSNLYGEDVYIATFEYMPSVTRKVTHQIKEDEEDMMKTLTEYGGLEIQVVLCETYFSPEYYFNKLMSIIKIG